MREITGNLIDLAEAGEFDVICHGCNCQTIMGAGIAAELKERHPCVYLVDVEASKAGHNTLGNISVADCGKFKVVNCYTQQTIGRGLQVSYAAITSALRKVRQWFPTQRIGVPLIGCGLAGGEEAIVLEIMNKEIPEATLVRFQPRRNIPRSR
jgi:O-acetyl-ADP-ribose deacetylase (regulator of RNase III)